MTTSVDGRLQRLIGGQALVALRKRLRQRYQRQPLEQDIARFRISNLTASEHAALASLLGRSVRFSSSMEVDVREIDVALSRAGIANSLREALELIDGPIVHLETARRELAAAWAAVVSTVGHPSLATFLEAPSGVGLLKRLSGSNAEAAARLCRSADTVLSHLPANGVTRAQLAAKTLGDPHALDNGRAVAGVVLAVWRDVIAPDADTPASTDEEGIAQRNERTRDIWAKAGVLVNELARPALFLNLTMSGDKLAYPSGEPGFASLRFLVRSSPSWTVAGRDVFICENPNLLAIAADRWGAACAPMVSTDGMPAAAQRVLLAQLVEAGARLHYHGDFDWAGIRIGNHVVREYNAVPWRFGADEYAAAIVSAPRPGQPLGGPAVVAMWDARLTPMMQTQRLSIAEESVADSLLKDLAQ